MATKITASDFTASLTDNLELNGRSYGGLADYTVTECNEADQRIVSVAEQATAIAGTYTSLFLWDATLNSAGQGIQTEFKYFRITNLDSENALLVQIITTGTTQTLQIKLDAGQSYMIQNAKMAVLCAAMPETGYPNYETIAEVRASAETAAIDVEIVSVFKTVV